LQAMYHDKLLEDMQETQWLILLFRTVVLKKRVELPCIYACQFSFSQYYNCNLRIFRTAAKSTTLQLPQNALLTQNGHLEMNYLTTPKGHPLRHSKNKLKTQAWMQVLCGRAWLQWSQLKVT
jgi:hypothetical protein